MTAAVFVDTNILVYLRDERSSTKQRLSNEWLTALWRDQSGRTSFQVLSEYYVTVTRKLRPQMDPAAAWADVHELMAWKPQEINAALLHEARGIETRYKLSWWDSLIVGAARLQDCKWLLTEDLQDGAVVGGVVIRNPFLRTLSESLAEYEVRSEPKRLHPSRGRPVLPAR